MRKLLALAMLVPACLTAPEERPTTGARAGALWQTDFRRNDWLTEWSARPEGRFGMDNLRVVDEEGGRWPRFLRVVYYKGSASPSASRRVGVKEGGGQFFSRLDQSHDRLFLRYWVRFDPRFDFVKGGKLPGFYGGTQVSGGSIPDGTNGFSTRFMWRRDGMGEVYAYTPTSPAFGTSLGRGSWTFARGQWQCLEQELVLNTPGQLDGVVRTWLDGKLVYENTRLLFRTVPTLRIEGVFFSTFFGGGDESWAPPEDTRVDFAHFAVGGRRLGCD